MKTVLPALLIILLATALASAQGLNKIVFGPLEGDSAGVLTVHYGEDIEIEMWIHVDPENPGCIYGIAHGLMSEDAIIAERNGAIVDPYFDEPYWAQVWVEGPYGHNPDDNFPIPEGHTGEMLIAIASTFGCDSVLHILPDTGWVYYGSFLMACAVNVPTGETYHPFAMAWLPHSGQGTSWAFEAPPGGSVVPEQDYCGLYFDEIIVCNYIPGDCNYNGVPLELDDIMAVYSTYRGIAEPHYICDCNADPPGPDFAATGDPNGNCVANELSDVVAEVAAYRGHITASGCPDCPGSEGLVIRESRGQ